GTVCVVGKMRDLILQLSKSSIYSTKPVGTTVTRCLESAYSREHNCLKASSGWTALYIHPGYQLKVVDCLLTNLHQPKTTHMVLTGQFAGVDLLMKAYASEDIQSCQFDMFGDCMLIIQDEGQG
ncbi:S-adenosylmethionine:tRNA ribosyltransferase-isomerase, partial [Salmonella enterica]